MDKAKYMKNFSSPEEKLLFSKACDQAFVCESRNIPSFTSFLDPLKINRITEILAEEFACKIIDYGGAEGCERRMLGFFPDYMEPNYSEFPIVSAEIETSSDALTHRDYLGSILGTGVQRELIGDIFVFEKKAVAFISEKISAHVLGALNKIGNKEAHVSIIQDEYLLAPFIDMKELDIVVSSMRLDNVLAKIFHISRGQTAKLIESEKAFVNWVCVKSASSLVKEGDLITLRGFGRTQIKDVNSLTKKGNFHVTVLRT